MRFLAAEDKLVIDAHDGVALLEHVHELDAELVRVARKRESSELSCCAVSCIVNFLTTGKLLKQVILLFLDLTN